MSRLGPAPKSDTQLSFVLVCKGLSRSFGFRWVQAIITNELKLQHLFHLSRKNENILSKETFKYDLPPPKNKVIRVISLYNKQSNPISGPGVHHFALDIRLRPKHSVVLASLLEGGYAAFDFVPADAEDPKAAVQLLLGADDEGMDGYGTRCRWRLDK